MYHSSPRISLLPLFKVDEYFSFVSTCVIPFQSCLFSAATTNTNTFEILFVLLIIFQFSSHCVSNHGDKNNQKPIVLNLYKNAYTPTGCFWKNWLNLKILLAKSIFEKFKNWYFHKLNSHVVSMSDKSITEIWVDWKILNYLKFLQIIL